MDDPPLGGFNAAIHNEAGKFKVPAAETLQHISAA